jgi:hypothetical protein
VYARMAMLGLHPSLCMAVIPAKAGIQFKYVVRSTHYLFLYCVLRTPCFTGFRAFAGMKTERPRTCTIITSSMCALLLPLRAGEGRIMCQRVVRHGGTNASEIALDQCVCQSYAVPSVTKRALPLSRLTMLT